MSDIRTRLADALLEHAPHHKNNSVDLWVACKCGNGVRYYDRRKHVAHVADVLLSLPGIAIVELPEPHGTAHKASSAPPFAWSWQWRGFDIEAQRDCVGFRYLSPPFDFDTPGLEPEDAREFAAALLAAADAAEADR
jgi:hypothetical protein